MICRHSAFVSFEKQRATGCVVVAGTRKLIGGQVNFGRREGLGRLVWDANCM